jgi:hypothetical protein
MSQQVAQQALDAQGGVDLGLPVRAVNRSDQDVVWQYDRIKYVIPAGGERMVPYMAMVYWQGDPRAIDVPGGRLHEQFRRQQYAHLRILYGVYEESEGHNRWADIPEVVCYPLDSDVPFNTVLRDPDGRNMMEQVDSSNDLRFMRDQMERMATQMRVMQANYEQQSQSIAATEAAGVDPADLERQETEHRTVAPEEATGQSMVGPSPTRRTPAPKGKAAVTRDGE